MLGYLLLVFDCHASSLASGRWFSISVLGRTISSPRESSNDADMDPFILLQLLSSCRGLNSFLNRQGIYHFHVSVTDRSHPFFIILVFGCFALRFLVKQRKILSSADTQETVNCLQNQRLIQYSLSFCRHLPSRKKFGSWFATKMSSEDFNYLIFRTKVTVPESYSYQEDTNRTEETSPSPKTLEVLFHIWEITFQNFRIKGHLKCLPLFKGVTNLH